MLVFLLSPTKTLTYGGDEERLEELGMFTAPAKLPSTELLMDVLRKKTKADIKALMKLSNDLAALNHERYQAWQEQNATTKPDDERLKQAAFAFDGPAFRGLDVRSLSKQEIQYLQNHLRILSGLYGVLRPLDVMQPYRLEMGTKLAVDATGTKTLYEFWSTQGLTRALLQDVQAAQSQRKQQPVIVNVASNEYSRVIERDALRASGHGDGDNTTVEWVDCVFKHDGRIISTYAKRARGLMVRYACRSAAASVEDLKAFDLEGYRYNAAQSSSTTLVFTRTQAQYTQALQAAKDAKDAQTAKGGKSKARAASTRSTAGDQVRATKHRQSKKTSEEGRGEEGNGATATKRAKSVREAPAKGEGREEAVGERGRGRQNQGSARARGRGDGHVVSGHRRSARLQRKAQQ